MSNKNKDYDEYYYREFQFDTSRNEPKKKTAVISPYAKEFFAKYSIQFPNTEVKDAASTVVAEAAITADSAPKVAPKPTIRLAVVIIVALLSLVTVVLASLSYFGVLGNYTKILVNGSLKDIINIFATNFSGYEAVDIFAVCAYPGLILLGLLFVIVELVLALVGIFGKKRINLLWLFSLLSLLAFIGSAILIYFMCRTSIESIMAFINPLEPKVGLMWGYYGITALSFLMLIMGCFAYRPKRKFK